VPTDSISKRLSALLALLLQLHMSFFWTRGAHAVTSGPSQPEVQSPTPDTETRLVDPFTGDFSYSIPLLDVGGYPLTLSYRSGIGMDEEASFVGLGWSLNPGSITREVRGIPDDFNGDPIRPWRAHWESASSFSESTLSPPMLLWASRLIRIGESGLTWAWDSALAPRKTLPSSRLRRASASRPNLD
jgi:hypothetical protein